MTCYSDDQFRELVDNPLATLGDHAQECTTCARQLDELRALAGSLAPLPRPVDRQFVARAVERAFRRRPAPRRIVGARLALGLAAAFATVVVLFIWIPRNETQRGFAVRGNAGPQLIAYRIARDGTTTRLEDAIDADDELAFAYSHVPKAMRLLVFAVDEHRNVYWFHPAWTDASRDPVAVAIPPADERRELGRATSHRYQGRRLTLYGVFTDELLSVRRVEALAAEAGEGRVHVPSVATRVQNLQVRAAPRGGASK